VNTKLLISAEEPRPDRGPDVPGRRRIKHLEPVVAGRVHRLAEGEQRRGLALALDRRDRDRHVGRVGLDEAEIPGLERRRRPRERDPQVVGREDAHAPDERRLRRPRGAGRAGRDQCDEREEQGDCERGAPGPAINHAPLLPNSGPGRRRTGPRAR
jgi:hypothetical protein